MVPSGLLLPSLRQWQALSSFRVAEDSRADSTRPARGGEGGRGINVSSSSHRAVSGDSARGKRDSPSLPILAPILPTVALHTFALSTLYFLTKTIRENSVIKSSEVANLGAFKATNWGRFR